MSEESAMPRGTPINVTTSGGPRGVRQLGLDAELCCLHDVIDYLAEVGAVIITPWPVNIGEAVDRGLLQIVPQQIGTFTPSNLPRVTARRVHQAFTERSAPA